MLRTWSLSSVVVTIVCLPSLGLAQSEKPAEGKWAGWTRLDTTYDARDEGGSTVKLVTEDGKTWRIHPKAWKKSEKIWAGIKKGDKLHIHYRKDVIGKIETGWQITDAAPAGAAGAGVALAEGEGEPAEAEGEPAEAESAEGEGEEPAEGEGEQPAEESSEEPAAEEEDEPLSLRWAQVTPSGQTGYGEMITPHIPGGGDLAIRVGLYLQTQSLSIDERIGAGTIRVDVNAQVYSLQAAVGFNDMVEVSLSLPIIDYELSSNVTIRDQKAGFGNPEVGAKFNLPIGLDLISVAAYTRIVFGWGNNELLEPKQFPFPEGYDSNQWEWGGAFGVHLGKLASGYMNLGMRLIEGGTQTFRYRFGVAVHPVELVQFGFYFDGEEFEGSAGSNGTVGLNAALNFEPVFVMANFDWLLQDNGIDGIVTSGGGDDVDLWTFGIAVGASF